MQIREQAHAIYGQDPCNTRFGRSSYTSISRNKMMGLDGSSANNIYAPRRRLGRILEEAQAGESRGEFIHKPGIAREETRKSRYRLTLLEKSDLVSTARIEPLRKETKELLNVITAIILSSKAKG